MRFLRVQSLEGCAAIRKHDVVFIASEMLRANVQGSFQNLHAIKCPDINVIPSRVCRRHRGLPAHSFKDNATLFTDADYQTQKQAEARTEWAANVRAVTGSRHHRFWEPELSPPALLSQVTVVLVSPRRPVSVGTVARACSCFEIEDIRIVAPRCEYLTRQSKSASKGAQYLLHRMQLHDDILKATEDCDLRVAFTRWAQGCPLPLYDLPALPKHPVVASLIRTPAPVPDSTLNQESAPSQSASTSSQSTQESQPHSRASSVPRPVRVALVFGREELGMSDEEVSQCDVVCSIPIGRLQESLSLSHAVSLACSAIFQERLTFIAPGPTALVPSHGMTEIDGSKALHSPDATTSQQCNGMGYRVGGRDSLTAGFDENWGRER